MSPPSTVLNAALTSQAARAALTLIRSEDGSLSGGRAGGLVLAVALHAVTPEPASDERLDEAVQAVVEALSEHALPPSLWSGLPGLLYALEYLDDRLPGRAGRHTAAFVASMDDLLIAFARDASPERLHFDLISGATGLGAYALMRRHEPAARALYQAVEARLIEQATPEAGGRAWRWPPTPPSVRPSDRMSGSDLQSPGPGRLDYGIAHGQPGVALLLAAGLREGLTACPATSAELLRDLVSHLLAVGEAGGPGARYPYFLPGPPPSETRLGWCYGDLGVALALREAGRVLADPALVTHARRLALDRLARHASTFRLTDDGLCHGRAGVLLLGGKLGLDPRLPALARIRAELRTDVPATDGSRSRSRSGVDLLDGASGVLLSQLDAGGGRRGWDTALCLGA